MKISIITVCYNSASTIERAIKSVLSQDYSNIEYIIIDGGSTDGTVEIINKYKDKITQFVSEKDEGIYDAMNKGIALATGDIVGILNSDDFYADNFILSEIANAFGGGMIDAVYGNVAYFISGKEGKIFRYWKAGEFSQAKIKNGWMPPHPAFFVKKDWYKRYGNFRLDFGTSADYELLLRFMLAGIKMKYVNKTFVNMQAGGASGKSFLARWRAWQMIRKAWTVNNKRPPLFLIERRILSKFTQFIFRRMSN